MGELFGSLCPERESMIEAPRLSDIRHGAAHVIPYRSPVVLQCFHVQFGAQSPVFLIKHTSDVERPRHALHEGGYE